MSPLLWEHRIHGGLETEALNLFCSRVGPRFTRRYSCKGGVPHINNAEVKERCESSRICDDFHALTGSFGFTGTAHDEAAAR